MGTRTRSRSRSNSLSTRTRTRSNSLPKPSFEMVLSNEQDLENGFDEETGKKKKKSGFLQFLKHLSWRKRLTLLSIIAVEPFSSSCFAIVAPFYPSTAASKGSSGFTTGVVFGVFQLVMFILSPIIGAYITKIGAKQTFSFGVIVGGISTIAFGFVDKLDDGFPFIFASISLRCVQAAGTAAYYTASYAIVAYEFQTHVGLLSGLLETAGGIGYMIGPAIGGVLYEVGGFLLPFMVMGCLMVAIGVLTYFLLSKDIGDNETSHMPLLALSKMLTYIQISLICCVIVAGSACYGVLEPILEGHLELIDPGITKIQIGLVFLAGSAVYGVFSPIAGYLVDVLPFFSRILMTVGSVVAIVGYVFMGPFTFIHLPSSVWLVTVSIIVNEAGLALGIIPTFRELMLASYEIGYSKTFETDGMVSGLNAAGWALGSFLGPTFGALFAEKYGFSWTLFLMSVIIICFVTTPLLLILTLFPRSNVSADDSALDYLLEQKNSTKCTKRGKRRTKSEGASE